MKNYSIVLIFFLLLFTTCKERKQASSGSGDTFSGESFYAFSEQLDKISLPLTGNELNSANNKLILLPEKYNSVFYEESFPINKAYIGKIFPKDSNSLFLIAYQYQVKNIVIELFTFSDQLKRVDQLTVYSTEEIFENINIYQDFEIFSDYRIKVKKELDNTIIEQLYYNFDSEGFFHEMRDGKTPAIAYESPDNIRYFVDSFIWGTNTYGGLSQKNLIRKNYTLDIPNKELILIE